MDRSFQNESMTRIPLEELDYGSDGLYYHDGKPFSGTALYLDGEWPQAEADYCEGVLWGWKREWYRPDVIEREAECAWGARHGVCREWDTDGHLVAEGMYELVVRVRVRRWDSNGMIIEEFEIQESDPAYQILLAARAAPNQLEHDV
jgi:antitoxin component YwqK of YwqJK toxin-antitoxin module